MLNNDPVVKKELVNVIAATLRSRAPGDPHGTAQAIFQALDDARFRIDQRPPLKGPKQVLLPQCLPMPSRWIEHREKRYGDCYRAREKAERSEWRVMSRWLRRHGRQNTFNTLPQDWLDPRSWFILNARWRDQRTLKNVGWELKLGQERIRQIERKAQLIIWRKWIRLIRSADRFGA